MIFGRRTLFPLLASIVSLACLLVFLYGLKLFRDPLNNDRNSPVVGHASIRGSHVIGRLQQTVAALGLHFPFAGGKEQSREVYSFHSSSSTSAIAGHDSDRVPAGSQPYGEQGSDIYNFEFSEIDEQSLAAACFGFVTGNILQQLRDRFSWRITLGHLRTGGDEIITGRKSQTVIHDYLAERLYVSLYRNQFCSKCSRALAIGLGSGLGSRFNMMALGLSEALRVDRRMLHVDDQWAFVSQDKVLCPNSSFTCYTQRSSSCDAPTFAEYSSKCPASGYNPASTAAVVCNSLNFNCPEVYLAVPEPYRKLRGLLWYNSHLHYWILQPSPSMLDQLKHWHEKHSTRQERSQAKEQSVSPSSAASWSPIDTPCIAVSVRHGDKYKEAKLFPLSAYVEKIRLLAAAFHVHHVFLSTEDPEVIADTVHYPEFSWQFTEFPRANLNVGALAGLVAKGAIKAQEIDAETRNSILNLWLATECQYLVGTFSSNWSRLILKMMIAHRGYVPPHYSLDGWSWDFWLRPENKIFDGSAEAGELRWFRNFTSAG